MIKKSLKKFSLLVLVIGFGLFFVGQGVLAVDDVNEGKLVSCDELYDLNKPYNFLYFIRDGKKLAIPFSSIAGIENYAKAILDSNNLSIDDLVLISKSDLEYYALGNNLLIEPSSEYVLNNYNKFYIVSGEGYLSQIDISDPAYNSHSIVSILDAYFVNYKIDSYFEDYSGQVVKMDLVDAIYFVSKDNTRYVVPSLSNYMSYRDAILSSYEINSTNARVISQPQLESIHLVANLTIRPGKRFLLKKDETNRYYILDNDNYILEVKKDSYPQYEEIVVPVSIFDDNYIILNSEDNYPDLVPEDLVFYKEKNSFKNVVYVKVCNNGYSVDINSNGFSVGYKINGAEKWINTSGGDSYDMGECKEKIITSGLQDGDDYKFEIDIDKFNDIMESNELNNEFVKNIKVESGDLPDLKIKSILLAPNNLDPLVKDMTVYFNVIDCEKFSNYRIKLYDKNSGYTDYKNVNSCVQSNADFSLEQGDYDLVFTIDSDNDIEESNEDNNTFEKSVSVIINSIDLKPSSLFVSTPDSSNIYFNFCVKNTGNEISDKIKVFFYNLSTKKQIKGWVKEFFNTSDDQNIPAIKASSEWCGAYVVISGNSFFNGDLLKGQDNHIKLSVDIDNSVDETNEINNSLIKNFSFNNDKDNNEITTKSEQTKCIFNNSTKEQKCDLAGENDQYNCIGKESCTINVTEENTKKLTWKSSCGGYGYTTVDGSDESIEFDCSQDPETVTIIDNTNRLYGNKFDEILTELKQLRDTVREQNTKIKYLEKLTKGVKKLASKMEEAINNFITYGVDKNTQRLGEGERAAVMYSYKSAFNKLPETEEELADAIKIANGRWPGITNQDAEKRAKEQFQKIYKRIANMNNASDNAAVTVMAYGLRQRAENRNLNSEKVGIKTFKNIYGYHPNSTEDWNIMQAITYSGATRGVDSDGDLLTDEREAELGTDLDPLS